MSNELELVKKNVGRFLAVTGAELVQELTEEGPITRIAEEEIPVMAESTDLKLVQRAAAQTYKEKGIDISPHFEKFYFPNLEESFSELRLIPVCIVNYSRVLYEGEYKAGQQARVICRSGNGFTPRADIDIPQNDVCAKPDESDLSGLKLKDVCPNAQWVRDEAANKSTCACPLHVTLGFLAIDMGFVPVHIDLHGSAMTQFNKFMAEYNKKKSSSRIPVRGKEKKSVNDYIVVLKAVSEGQYCIPKFELVYAPEVGAKNYAALAEYYSNTVFRMMREKADRPADKALAGSDGIETINPVEGEDPAASAESFEINI